MAKFPAGFDGRNAYRGELVQISQRIWVVGGTHNQWVGRHSRQDASPSQDTCSLLAKGNL